MISASRGADFPMIPRESALFSSSCKLMSLRIVPYHVTAKASAAQAPWVSPRHQFIYTSTDASRPCRNGGSLVISTQRFARVQRVFCLYPAYLLVELRLLIHTAVSFASFFLTTPVERRLNTALPGADPTEMMQDYPLHVLVKAATPALEAA